MPSLHCRGLTVAHTSASRILDAVDLDLATHPTHRAWIGVVGANGAGKSTLLRVLAGQLVPAAGAVEVQADLAPILVDQHVDELSAAVLAFAGQWDGLAMRLRSRLGLDPDDLDPDGVAAGWVAGWVAGDAADAVPAFAQQRWRWLSPGQRTRWKLAAALAAEPDVLLLDEPTNHLDPDARALVLDVLDGFGGLGLIVSHDRTVLARLTDRTLRVRDAHATLHAGSYLEAAARWRAEDAARAEAHDRAVREQRRIRRQLADARRARADTERVSAAARRHGSDPEARSMGERRRTANAEQAYARQVAATHSRLARAQAAVEADVPARSHEGEVGFVAAGSGRRLVVEVVGDVAHAGGQVWLHDVEVSLARGEAVHLRGANGAGKTTLIRALRTRLAATGEVLAYLPQELDDPRGEVVRVRALDPALRGRVLGIAARLGVDPDRVLVTDAPSPGEARKLALARLLAEPAGVLVLDEPTNHLDLPSIERLEQALQSWSGALVLVTHDDALAAAVTRVQWQVAQGRVTVVRSMTDA